MLKVVAASTTLFPGMDRKLVLLNRTKHFAAAASIIQLKQAFLFFENIYY